MKPVFKYVSDAKPDDIPAKFRAKLRIRDAAAEELTRLIQAQRKDFGLSRRKPKR